MGKGAHKSQHARKRDFCGVPLRHRNVRPPKDRILLVGEGRETEQNYFDQLKRDENINGRFAITVKGASGHSPEDVVNTVLNKVKEAQLQGDAYEQVWCVLDVEDIGKRPSLIRARRTAKRNKIKLFLSNPSFEVWLLSHFAMSHRAFINSAAVEVELDKHWQAKFDLPYDKSDRDIFPRLKDRTDKAIANAQHVRERMHGASKDIVNCNSATDVYNALLILRS